MKAKTPVRKTAVSSAIIKNHEPSVIIVPDIFAACARIVSSGGRLIEGPAPASFNFDMANQHEIMAIIKDGDGKKSVFIERINRPSRAGFYL